MRVNKKVIRRILHYLKPYWFFMLCSLIFAAVSALLALYLPVLTGQAVDLIIGKGQVDIEAVKSVILKMLCIIGVSALGQWIMNACNNHVAYCSVRDIRHSAFERLQKLPLSYMDSHPTGDILSRMIADVDTFADGLLMGFTQFFTGILTIIGTLILMVSIHKWVALVVILLTPLSLFVAAFIAKNTSSFFKQQSVTKGVQTTIIDEMIGNEKLVKAFSHEAEAEEVSFCSRIQVSSCARYSSDLRSMVSRAFFSVFQTTSASSSAWTRTSRSPYQSRPARKPNNTAAAIRIQPAG